MKKSIFLVNLMVLPTFAMNTPNSDELSQPQSAKYVSLNDNLEDDGLNLCLVEEDILNPENSAQNLSDAQALLLDALLDNLKLVATDVGLRGAGTILRGVGGLAQVAGTKFTGARVVGNKIGQVGGIFEAAYGIKNTFSNEKSTFWKKAGSIANLVSQSAIVVGQKAFKAKAQIAQTAVNSGKEIYNTVTDPNSSKFTKALKTAGAVAKVGGQIGAKAVFSKINTVVTVFDVARTIWQFLPTDDFSSYINYNKMYSLPVYTCDVTESPYVQYLNWLYETPSDTSVAYDLLPDNPEEQTCPAYDLVNQNNTNLKKISQFSREIARGTRAVGGNKAATKMNIGANILADLNKIINDEKLSKLDKVATGFNVLADFTNVTEQKKESAIFRSISNAARSISKLGKDGTDASKCEILLNLSKLGRDASGVFEWKGGDKLFLNANKSIESVCKIAKTFDKKSDDKQKIEEEEEEEGINLF